MTNNELRDLFTRSNERISELARKRELGMRLSRRDCIELQTCNRRLRAVAHELWVRAGRPDDPEFDMLREPYQPQPLPSRFRPLDLTTYPSEEEVH